MEIKFQKNKLKLRKGKKHWYYVKQTHEKLFHLQKNSEEKLWLKFSHRETTEIILILFDKVVKLLKQYLFSFFKESVTH